MNIIKLLVIFSLMAYGCVPYSSNFSCENLKGSGRTCSTVSSNLDYAIKGGNQNPETSKNVTITEEKINDNLTIEIKKCDNSTGNCIVVDEKSIDVTLKKENSNPNTLKSLSETLKEFTVDITSPTGKPIITQPKVVKITILPYIDTKKRLNMSKDVYLILDNPRFVIGDFLINQKGIKNNDSAEEIYKNIKFNIPNNKKNSNSIVKKDNSEKSKVIPEIDKNEK